jgi:hypothetical protein
MSEVKRRLKEIVDSAVEGIPSEVETMIVSGHLAQMKMWGIRAGVEFFASQDNFGAQRKDFVEKVTKYNQIDVRLDSIWAYFMSDGVGFFYVRPVEGTYKIFYFRKNQYRTYYDENGDLEKVVIIYSYKVRRSNGFGQSDFDVTTMQSNVNNALPMSGDSPGTKKYLRIEITKTTVKETRSMGQLGFDVPAMGAPGETKELVNSLGFVPGVEVFNNPRGFTNEGESEFDWLASHIVAHDDMCRTMRKNISFFGNPTLLSSRPKSDLVESGDDGLPQRPSIASRSGFSGVGTRNGSTFRQDPVMRGVDGSIRVPRVISNLEPNDRVGYITPTALTGDQAKFAAMYREEIRTALGGVDELSISAGVTATEFKSLFGRVSATAKKKCRALYTYGICRCLELMIFQEERLFRETFALAMEMPKPPELPEGADETAKGMYQKVMKMYDKELDLKIVQAIEARNLPPGVVGLIPDGDISVNWRWTGPVYEESTQDVLNNSIVVRNLQELGVDSIEALKYLFPSKTDEERAEMLSGYPFRMIGELQSSFTSFAKTVGGLMSTPHPQAPDLPMAADPRFDMTPYLYRTLEALQKEMSYAGRYRPIDPADKPDLRVEPVSVRTSGSGGDGSAAGPGVQLPGTSGVPQLRGTPSTNQLQYPGPAAGTIRESVALRPPIPTTGQPMGVGVQQSSGTLERSSPIPIPGSTVDEPTGGPGVLPVQQPSYVQLGSADLFNKPDLLAQLFPNIGGAITQLGNQASGSGIRAGSTGNPEPVRPKPGKRR